MHLGYTSLPIDCFIVRPREIEDNVYAKFGRGGGELHYGLCENGE